MKTFPIVVPCHFGLEAVLKREIIDLGYDIERVEDGRITFLGDAEALCRANVFLRTAERVMICAGRFKAYTFDELFEGIKAIEWEQWIPKDGKFWVTKATTVNSKLFSSSDIQSIVKKAMVERPGLRHLLNPKIPTSRRNAVFFCQILPFYLLYGVVFYLGLCYNRV